MSENINNFLASHPFSEHTKDQYRRVLSLLLKEEDPETLTPAAALAFVSRPNWGNSQRYTALCAIRSYIRHTYGSAHPALKARIKRTAAAPGRALTAEQYLSLLTIHRPDTEKGIRDLALMLFATDTAFRVSELANVQVKNIIWTPITIHELNVYQVSVTIKGGRLGRGIFSETTARALDNWLTVRPSKGNTGNLFTSCRNDETRGAPLTRNGLKSIIKKWGNQAGFKLSPHDLRRSFATLTTASGAPSRTVQLGGRWSNLNMVQLYTGQLQQAEIAPYLPSTKLLQN